MENEITGSIFDEASTWQIAAAVAAIWAVVATFASPFISSILTSRWQEHQEKKRQKLFIFAALIQDRGTPINQETVRAYNLIDSVFHDCRIVRDAWSDYYSSLRDKRLNSEEGNRIREDKRNILLQKIADDIGFKNLSSTDFERVYYPEGLAEQDEINWLQRQVVKRDLQDRLQDSSQGRLPFNE